MRKIFHTVGKVLHTVGNSVGNFRRIWGKVWNFLITPLLRGKTCGRTQWYDLIDVIERNWIILYKWIVRIISPRAIIVTLLKNFNGRGGICNRFDSILPLRIRFIYRNAFPEYKDGGRRFNYPSNIFPTIEISNGMFGENFTPKDLMGTQFNKIMFFSWIFKS